MTGAPLPPGADAVVKVENTESADGHVIIHQEMVRAGENIRPVGADVRAGELLVRAGRRIGPAEIGLLAAFGIDPVEVRRRPRASVISTGDELVEPQEPLAPGKIRDSNRFSLIAALRNAGADVIWSGKGPDDRGLLEMALKKLISESDVVVTSGGVSMGELDLIKAILGDLATVHFRRVFLKPGKPLNFATVGNTLIFGLPGNPVSALVAVELFIRPALDQMSGAILSGGPKVRVRLGQSVAPTDRIEYHRAIVRVDRQGSLVAESTGGQASSRLASLIGANALLIIPPRDMDYSEGEVVDAILIGQVYASGA
jgi:gephyrin